MHASKISIDVIIRLRNNICKIFYQINNQKYYGTGFFMLLNNYIKCLLTAYHVISENTINNSINIEIYNKKIIKLKLNDRFIKFYEKFRYNNYRIKRKR